MKPSSILLAGITLLFISCNRHDAHTGKPQLPETATLKRMGLQEGTPDVPAMRAALTAGAMFSKFAGKLDFGNVRKLQGRDYQVYIVALKGGKDKFYAAKTTHFKTIVVESEVLYSKVNGVIGILKAGEALTISFALGQTIIKELDGLKYEPRFMQRQEEEVPGMKPMENINNAALFCQRKGNENFGVCYRREKDEFCDSFFSCLAADTSPYVPILIALACSCKEDPALRKRVERDPQEQDTTQLIKRLNDSLGHEN